MRYEGTRLSRGQNQAELYLMAMGVEELRLIHDIALNAWMNIPKNILALQPTRQRLNSIRKTTGETLGIYKIKTPKK